MSEQTSEKEAGQGHLFALHCPLMYCPHDKENGWSAGECVKQLTDQVEEKSGDVSEQQWLLCLYCWCWNAGAIEAIGSFVQGMLWLPGRERE